MKKYSLKPLLGAAFALTCAILFSACTNNQDQQQQPGSAASPSIQESSESMSGGTSQ